MFRIAIEGRDGSGKSSVIACLQKKVQMRGVRFTRHPGEYAFGTVIRQLMKDPCGVYEALGYNCVGPVGPIKKLSPRVEQILALAEYANFLDHPDDSKVIISDRYNPISGMVYGLAAGLDLAFFYNWLNLLNPPRLDRLFVLECSDEEVARRKQSEGCLAEDANCAFEQREDAQKRKLNEVYSNLEKEPYARYVSQVVASHNIIRIDTTVASTELIANVILGECRPYLGVIDVSA